MSEVDTTEEITQKISVESKRAITKFLRGIDYSKFAIFILAILAVLGSYGSLHFYSKFQSVKNSPNALAERETAVLVSAVGKLMELPKGETPTIAVISDQSKLKEQPFFSAALNGDALLAYTTAKIAILYRASTNKIINVAAITIPVPNSK